MLCNPVRGICKMHSDILHVLLPYNWTTLFLFSSLTQNGRNQQAVLQLRSNVWKHFGFNNSHHSKKWQPYCIVILQCQRKWIWKRDTIADLRSTILNWQQNYLNLWQINNNLTDLYPPPSVPTKPCNPVLIVDVAHAAAAMLALLYRDRWCAL